MSNCQIPYIEQRFRESDPEKADYFNNLVNTLWNKVDNSLLFTYQSNNSYNKFIANVKKTLKRKKQDEFINSINSEFNQNIIKITNDNFVNINLTPLFEEDTTSYEDKLNNIPNTEIDINKYLYQGYDVKNAILQYIQDKYLDRPTYVQTRDEFLRLEPGSFIISPKSEKVTRSKNPRAAARAIASSLENKIEGEVPGVKVIVNLDSNPVRLKIVPSIKLINKYADVNFNEQTQGLQDKNLREKYFNDNNITTDKEILTKISQSNHPLNKVAEQLIPFSKNVKVELIPVKDFNLKNQIANGVYTTFGLGQDEKIEIAEFANFRKANSEDVIIHEIVHALTVNWLENVDKKDPLYVEFKKLYDESVLKLGKENFYALSNIKEFATALFSDAKFIKELRSLPSENLTKYSNLLENIFNHILKLFKVTDPESTLYNDAFAVVSNIINVQKELENSLITNINEFENLQDDLENYYIDNYSQYTNVPQNLFEEEIINPETNIKQSLEIKTDIIPNNLTEQFDEYESLKNKDAETTEELEKQVLYTLTLPNLSKDKFFKVFSQLDPEEFDNYRQREVNRIINTFAEKFGITIEQIQAYQDRYVLANNKSLSYNGVANLANKTIKYLEGDNKALTEEVAHFMVAMLPKNSPEYLSLKNYISKTPEYQLYYKTYLKVYNGDVDKTEEEIMGKVVANNLLGITENIPLSLKSIIISILNYIHDLFNPDYRREFKISVDNINHLFFTENFDTIFSEANISFDQFYSLNFVEANDEKVFNQSTDKMLDTILLNLKNQRQKFIENKQTNLVETINTLIDIITDQDSTISNEDRISNYINMSLIEIQKVNKAFNDFKNSQVIQDLESKDFKNLSRAEQEAQTQQDRQNHLNYIAAAITTVQNLKSFVDLIEWNFKGFNKSFSSLSKYNEIIKNLPDTYENNVFKQLLEITKDSSEISKMKGVYVEISKELLDVCFKSLNTTEQKNFLEITQTNLTPNVKVQEDINNDISVLSTTKDILTGKFSITSVGSTVKENIMPTNFQSDIFLKAVDNANAALRQYALMASAKESFEYSLLQEKLNQLGVFDETWISSKDDKGQLSHKLLQKYNFKLFKKSLVQKIIQEHLSKIIDLDNVLKEVKDNNPEILKQVVDKTYKSPNELKDVINKLFDDGVISKKLFLFLNNYVNGYETLYTLKLSEGNKNLTTINQNNLQKFKDKYITQLESNLNNLNFNKKGLPYFNPSFSFNDTTISTDQLSGILRNVIYNRREFLIKKYVTVPRIINGELNPIYDNQLAYVEGLLNYFKNNISFLEDEEGNVKLNYINYLLLGDDYMFNLSDKFSVPSINFIDQDYVNLEKDLQSSDPKKKQIAELKLQVIEKIRLENISHNAPSNSLEYIPKNNNAAFLSNSKEYRHLYNLIFRVALPGVLATSTTVNPLAGVMLYFLYQGGLDNLIYKPLYFFKHDKTESNTFSKAYKALLMSLKEGYNKNLRENTIIKNNESLQNEVVTGYKKIFNNIIEKIKTSLNKDRYKNNILLLGEYKIPKLFGADKTNKVFLSTDFLSNQKTIVQARFNYEQNIRFESWIRMVGDFNESREGVNNSNVINVIKDRYWFNKFYKPSAMLNAYRSYLGFLSGKLLRGNIQSAINNLTVGQFNVFLFTNPKTLPKTFIDLLKHNMNMLAMGTNIDNVVDNFITTVGNPNNAESRQAFFDALKNIFLLRSTNQNKYNTNLINHISMNLRKNRGTGYINYDESESILIKELNLTNTQALQNLGEKLIEQNIIFQLLNSKIFIDEDGKPVKNLKKYLKVENGIIVIDKTKLPKNLYLKTTVDLAYKNYYNIDINSGINITKITPKELGLLPLTNVELQNYLNVTMSNDINNLIEKSQGSYNIFNRSYWRNTFVGLTFLQFKDYALPALTSTWNSKKIYNNFTNYESGVLNSIGKAFDRVAVSGLRVVNKNIDFNKDSDHNLLIINNISKAEFLKELAVIKYFLPKANKKINENLKTLASDNKKFRKDTKRITSIDKLESLSLSWYLKNINLKSQDEINKKIEFDFNLNRNNPKFKEQLDYIKNLINKKYKSKNNLTNADIDQLNKYDVDQNYFDLVQAYLKLKIDLRADKDSINKLINFVGLSVGVVAILSVLKALEWPKNELDEEGKKILNFKDWLIATVEFSTSNLFLSYVPSDVNDAYGIDYKNFALQLYKLAPAISEIKRVTDKIKTNYADVNPNNITTEKAKELLRIQQLNGGKLPLLQPKLIINEKTNSYELIKGETLVANALTQTLVNKELLNNFEFSALDKNKFNRLKNKSFISSLAEKANINRSYKFGDRPTDDTQEEKQQKIDLFNAYKAELESGSNPSNK
jgi:hypothetical protein